MVNDFMKGLYNPKKDVKAPRKNSLGNVGSKLNNSKPIDDKTIDSEPSGLAARSNSEKSSSPFHGFQMSTSPGTTSTENTSPGTSSSGTASPKTAFAGTASFRTASPGTAFTGTTSPGSASPGTAFTGTTSPGSASPGAASPGTASPGTAFTGTTSPGSAFTGTTSSGTAYSDTTTPGANSPGTAFTGTSSPWQVTLSEDEELTYPRSSKSSSSMSTIVNPAIPNSTCQIPIASSVSERTQHYKTGVSLGGDSARNTEQVSESFFVSSIKYSACRIRVNRTGTFNNSNLMLPLSKDGTYDKLKIPFKEILQLNVFRDRVSFYLFLELTPEMSALLEDELKNARFSNDTPGEFLNFADSRKPLLIKLTPKHSDLEKVVEKLKDTARKLVRVMHIGRDGYMHFVGKSRDQSSLPYCIYKPPGCDAVEILEKDFIKLNRGEYLNDSLMTFYMHYILQHLDPAIKSRSHLFSSYFFEKLIKVIAMDSPDFYEFNRSWGKRSKLFEKDFIIVPICFESHWLVAIICYPGLEHCQNAKTGQQCSPPDRQKIAQRVYTSLCQDQVPEVPNQNIGSSRAQMKTGCFEDVLDEIVYSNTSLSLDYFENNNGETGDDSPIKQPCILIFDSMPGYVNHYNVVATLREFLKQRYIYECQTNPLLDPDRVFDHETFKGCRPRVPLQPNSSDCGLYCLQYIESFLRNPLEDFTLPIINLENWFPLEVVAGKRKSIAKLIVGVIIAQGKPVPHFPMMFNDDNDELYKFNAPALETDSQRLELRQNPSKKARYEDLTNDDSGCPSDDIINVLVPRVLPQKSSK